MQPREPALFLWKRDSRRHSTPVFSLFFRTECSKQELAFHFFNAIFDATGFRGLFLSKQNYLVRLVKAISGRNLHQSCILFTINSNREPTSLPK